MSKFTVRVCSGLVGLIVFSASAGAQVTVVAGAGRYGVDNELGLVLVSMTGEEVQQQWPGVKEAVQAGERFTFMEPLGAVVTGVRYDALDLHGDPVVVYFTDLPLFHITTPHAIVDEPKVPAVLGLWSPLVGAEELHIGIEIRGGSSQAYPKKSYAIEFVTGAGSETTMDISLLGMRSDDDWNLQALYKEPFRANNMVGHQIWMDIHQPYYATMAPRAMSGVRMEYAELFVNGTYLGLYGVGEQVDRKQLQLAEQRQEMRGELFKGADWGDEELGGAVTFSFWPPFTSGAQLWGGFEHVYPRGDPGWQALSDFVQLVMFGSDGDFADRVDEEFHAGNAVDYYLFLNLLKAGDNTGKNIFVARFDQGEPYFYVPWDLDATFGMAWDGSLSPETNTLLSNGLYTRWLRDLSVGGFAHQLCTRWSELREGPITPVGIKQRFQQVHDRLHAAGAYEREELAWPDYMYDAGHMDYLGDWLEDRILFLDRYFASLYAAVGMSETVADAPLHLHPNPATGAVMVGASAHMLPARLLVSNAMGQVVMETVLTDVRTAMDVGMLAPGPYQLTVLKEGVPPLHGRLLVE